MMKIDFEFVSTHRNRNLWPNPCLFEVPWSGNGQSTGLNALDPVSKQAPSVMWKGENILVSATVVSQTSDSVVVSAPLNSFNQTNNYYQGAEFSVPPSFRINGSKFLSQSGGLDWVQFAVSYSGVQSGDAVQIKVTTIPNTLFVPAGSDSPNAYTNQYLYNETQAQWVLIQNYDSEFHRVLATIPGGWVATDQYSIRAQLPSAGLQLGAGNTTTSVNLTGTPINVNLGDFIRIISTGEIVKITNFDSTTNFATVSPPLSIAFPATTTIEILAQSADNYKTLSYAGTSVSQHEQATYDISLVSGSVPNMTIKNGSGGYPIDYPFLYVEFYDTNHPTQNNLFSNNHANKSYFKVTTPTGLKAGGDEKFTKFTGDLSYKTIRFRPTSNFRVVWRLPTGEEIQFEETDTVSPQLPLSRLQTAVKFNLKRN